MAGDLKTTAARRDRLRGSDLFARECVDDWTGRTVDYDRNDEVRAVLDDIDTLLAENVRLRAVAEAAQAECLALLRWFLGGDDHTHEEDCGARGQHDLDVCREPTCTDVECEGPHCTCGATMMRDRARSALGEP